MTGQFVAGTITTTTDGIEYTFTPEMPLQPNRRYYHYISYYGTIRDLANNPLGQSAGALSFVTVP